MLKIFSKELDHLLTFVKQQYNILKSQPMEDVFLYVRLEMLKVAALCKSYFIDFQRKQWKNR